jgi:hypothetical protein
MKHFGINQTLRAGVIGLCLTGSMTASAMLPIAEYMFDEPGGVYATNTGTSSVTTPLEMFNNGVLADTHGPGFAKGGLDQRFVNGSTSGQAQLTTGGNTTTIDDNNLDAFVSFTLMGWMKSETVDGANTVVGNERRLVGKWDFSSDGYMLEGGESGPSQNYLRLRVGGSSVVSGANWGDLNQWTFFAVTYDGSLGTNNVNFYKGTQPGGENNAALVSTTTLAAGTVVDNGNALVVGGRQGGNAARSFDGIMDAVRIFGSQSDSSGALSLSEIQFWQSQVPEPSAVLLLSVGGVLLLRRRS